MKRKMPSKPIAAKPNVRLPLYRLRVVEMATKKPPKHKLSAAKLKEIVEA